MFHLRVSNSGKIYQKYVRFITSFFEFIGLVVQFLSQNTIVLFFQLPHRFTLGRHTVKFIFDAYNTLLNIISKEAL